MVTLPTPGVTTGPDWANQLNAAINTVNALAGVNGGVGQQGYTGMWFRGQEIRTTLTNVSPTLNRLYVTPVYIDRAITVDRFGVKILVAGTTGAVVRVGMYAADTDYNQPVGAPLVDTTIDATVVASTEAVVSVALSAGLYYVAAVSQGATCTCQFSDLPTGAPMSDSLNNVVSQVNATWNRAAHTRYLDSVTGALPTLTTSSFGTPTLGSPAGSGTIVVGMRRT